MHCVAACCANELLMVLSRKPLFMQREDPTVIEGFAWRRIFVVSHQSISVHCVLSLLEQRFCSGASVAPRSICNSAGDQLASHGSRTVAMGKVSPVTLHLKQEDFLPVLTFYLILQPIKIPQRLNRACCVLSSKKRRK